MEYIGVSGTSARPAIALYHSPKTSCKIQLTVSQRGTIYFRVGARRAIRSRKKPAINQILTNMGAYLSATDAF